MWERFRKLAGKSPAEETAEYMAKLAQVIVYSTLFEELEEAERTAIQTELQEAGGVLEVRAERMNSAARSFRIAYDVYKRDVPERIREKVEPNLSSIINLEEFSERVNRFLA